MNPDEVKKEMEKAITALRADLATLKTGRATPALVEQVMVEVYETRMPLVELATITVPEPSSLIITPFDQTIIRNVEKALAQDRDLGTHPVVDGQVIRITIPPPTGERRLLLVKQLGQKLESAKIMIRQFRHGEMKKIKTAFDAKQMSEDDRFRQEEELQKITDEFNRKIEEIGEQKEQELLTI